MAVEYMDRAQGHTGGIWPQTLHDLAPPWRDERAMAVFPARRTRVSALITDRASPAAVDQSTSHMLHVRDHASVRACMLAGDWLVIYKKDTHANQERFLKYGAAVHTVVCLWQPTDRRGAIVADQQCGQPHVFPTHAVLPAHRRARGQDNAWRSHACACARARM